MTDFEIDVTAENEEQWFCPYCGEPGGEPHTVYSREYQGESPHGGMVEWQDERCSLCAPHKYDEYDAADDRYGDGEF